MARVVLDAVAKAHLLEHLDVEHGALLDALLLDELHLLAQLFEALMQLCLDALDGAMELFLRSHVV